MRRSFVLLSLFLAESASAAPVITSLTPSTGKVTGGETVTIKGSGFTTPTVFFGTTSAASVKVIDASTLSITTPPLLPMTFDVTVGQGQDESTLPQAYTVTGDPSEAFETILFPVYSAPAHGAFGSLWVTSVFAATKTDQPVNVYGATDIYSCGVLGTPPLLRDFVTVPPNEVWQFMPGCMTTGFARVVYVIKAQANDATFNARVTDQTATASSLGTEIPVIRSSNMTTGRIDLLLQNVPRDAQYRLKLRLYALRPTVALVTTVGAPQTVVLQPGRDLFEPAYAEFTDFPVPVDPGTQPAIRIVIEQPQDIVAGPPMWAFITVTNNDTQQITTITPD